MASNINSSNIDGTYPIEGENNDSQGFRTNFTNTSTNFATAKAEIEDLQNKAVLKSPLIGEGSTSNTLTEPLNTAASTTAAAGFSIAEGVAPTAPTDGDVWVTAAGNLFVRLNGVNVDLTATGGSGDVNKVGTPVNDQVGVWTGDGTLEGAATLTYDGAVLDVTGSIDASVELLFTEQADHTFAPTATRGVLWVRNDSPNVLVFTNDDGVDTVLGSGGGGLPAGGTAGQILIKDSGVDGDASWQNVGAVSASATEYYPNYASYTKVINSQFTIDLVDAASLFRVGRRVKFDQTGTFTYGVVNAVDYNSTNANDTTVTLTMEGVDTIPAGTFDVALTTSGTAWSPIAADPFSGGQINDIATGSIGGTQWWVIVGQAGNLATSTDGGVTWTARSPGTTANLFCATYDPTSETFWVGGAATSNTGSWLINSTNGTTWNSVPITWPSNAAGDYVWDISFSKVGDYHSISVWDNDASTHDLYVSVDNFATAPTFRGSVASPALVSSDNNPNAVQQYWVYVTGIQSNYFTSSGDVSASADETASAAMTAHELTYISPHPSVNDSYAIWGASNGEIGINRIGSASSIDDVTFADAMRDFATSDLHDRVVCVGDSGTVGYIDYANLASLDAWTSVANGFAPLANVLCVDFNEVDGVFVACADNGQICRSSNGTN